MLGPLLLNIFLVDFFFILNDVDIASCADDNIPYVVVGYINDVVTSLKKLSKALFEWFKNNLLKSNGDKCHVFVSSSENANIWVDENDVRKSECEKLLGVKSDIKLTFEKDITDICSKAIGKFKP